MREIIAEGRDTNEAIELGCQKLGVERDLVSFEILALPKRGFLGLKNSPAKVRVYVEEPEPPKKPEPAPPQRREKQPERIEQPPQPQKERETQPVRENSLQKAAEPKRPPEEKPEQKQPFRAVENESPLEFLPVNQLEGKAKTAVEYLSSVLVEIGVHANITAARSESGVVLRLSGDGLGVIIGRRGETLDALQYLCGLVANREEGDYLRVTIDSGNYREKRERTLQQLARKISATALRYGRASTLEPMNPYERRIIHAAVSEIEGVTSASIGEEPNRRVVISPLNPRPQSPSRGPRPSGGQNRPGKGRPPRREGGPRDDRGPRPPRRDDRGPRPPRPQENGAKPTSTDLDRSYAQELARNPELGRPEQSHSPAPAPESAPVREKALDEGKDLPLYGKIDL